VYIKTENLEPSLEKLRIDTALPMWTSSRTGKAGSALVFPKTDTAEPIRMKLRKERLEPSSTKEKTDKAEASRTKLRREREELTRHSPITESCPVQPT